MAPLSRELALTDEELDELMASTWNMRIATLGPGTRINLTPLWFGWAGGRIYFFGRGQKVVNLRRSPDCTVLVDRNDRFPELQGAMFQGQATVLEDAAAEGADAHLEQARWQMGTKYAGGHGEAPPEDPSELIRNESSARGSSWRWVVVVPDRIVSWDNAKIAAMRERPKEKSSAGW
ncbi:MAG TPA: pyridoxamine 5'-phosphate oxidase family protein [Acidimicrobiales bacterium]|nr:pyridoxamine 5'-phosphate oxidase family protein [Acidimicrobiales bacterium]